MSAETFVEQLCCIWQKFPCRNTTALEFASVREIKCCGCTVLQDMLQKSFFHQAFPVRNVLKVLERTVIIIVKNYCWGGKRE